MLTQRVKQEIINEVFDLDISIHLETGLPVYNLDDKNYIDLDDKQIVVEDNAFVNIEYNEDIRADIGKFLPILLKVRTIIEPSLVDENTPAVKKSLKKLRSKNRIVSQNQKMIAINDIRRQYESQYELAVLQIVTWAMMRNHVFYFEKKQMMTDFEIEVDDDYWDTEIKPNVQDELADVMGVGSNQIQFKRNNKDALEIQIAIITSLTNDYEQFSDEAMKIVGACLIGLTLTTNDELGDIDNAGMFRSELYSYLPAILRIDNGNKQGKVLKRGVPRVSGNDKPQG